MKNAQVIGQNFADIIRFKQREIAKSLGRISCKVKIREEDKLVSNAEQLFQRISLLKKSETDFQTYFTYELAQMPLSLFEVGGMRKTDKSTLYHRDFFMPTEKKEIHNYDECLHHVIYGSFSLYRVVWPKNITYELLCNEFVKYVKRHYGSKRV